MLGVYRMYYSIRGFTEEDTSAVNALAISAFEQYRTAYTDWQSFSKSIGNMAALAESGEVIVAEGSSSIIGAVVYVGPNRSKADYFNPEWPIMRMLVVSPKVRGAGIGRRLAQECIQRAKGDKSPLFALHTASIMNVALSMYERMGFKFHSQAPDIFGVQYSVYVKQLHT
jgi:ribosomal protein S18 acetylase RimI-like enzyme